MWRRLRPLQDGSGHLVEGELRVREARFAHAARHPVDHTGRLRFGQDLGTLGVERRRPLEAAFFAVTGALSLAGTHEFWAHHIALKAVVFAGVIAIGTMIDPAARDFGPALQDIVANGETPERLERLNRSLRYAYPLVLAVYAGLITLAVIGIGRY